mmetsp:Transcript_19587/g.75124  ORF Transcript_19587/g.75124 Transcript_19587/m.75124 type:complete len:490 (-) Transcript_19587:1851-3320(-)
MRSEPGRPSSLLGAGASQVGHVRQPNTWPRDPRPGLGVSPEEHVPPSAPPALSIKHGLEQLSRQGGSDGVRGKGGRSPPHARWVSRRLPSCRSEMREEAPCRPRLQRCLPRSGGDGFRVEGCCHCMTVAKHGSHPLRLGRGAEAKQAGVERSDRIWSEEGTASPSAFRDRLQIACHDCLKASHGFTHALAHVLNCLQCASRCPHGRDERATLTGDSDARGWGPQTWQPNGWLGGSGGSLAQVHGLPFRMSASPNVAESSCRQTPRLCLARQGHASLLVNVAPRQSLLHGSSRLGHESRMRSEVCVQLVLPPQGVVKPQHATKAVSFKRNSCEFRVVLAWGVALCFGTLRAAQGLPREGLLADNVQLIRPATPRREVQRRLAHDATNVRDRREGRSQAAIGARLRQQRRQQVGVWWRARQQQRRCPHGIGRVHQRPSRRQDSRSMAGHGCVVGRTPCCRPLETSGRCRPNAEELAAKGRGRRWPGRSRLL